MAKKEKRRYDGYLVKNLDPVTMLMPHIMPRKTDSEVMIDLQFDLEKVESFIREQKKGDIPNLTLYHFLLAAVARAAMEYPQINRFISGNRIYQRRHVKMAMMVKKSLSIDGEESHILPIFETSDNLKDMVDKIQASAEEALAEKEGGSNGFDKLVKLFNLIPQFVLRGFIKFLIWVDRHGWLPAFLLDMQPFHASFFLTNVGSIGLPVLYHHLYEFGTCSGFLAMGQKEFVLKINSDGVVEKHKVLPVRFVGDSRICDGYAYSCGFREIVKCFEHPEKLLKSFDEVLEERKALDEAKQQANAE